jgi:2-oxoglutarate ferredoxin oxidoreductase subunit alpha
MQEGISYIASAELPCLLVNVNRGGPGLGTIQPSQGDYFQAVKGGGHGDYHLIVLAPASVQEMADFIFLSQISHSYDFIWRCNSQMMESKIHQPPIKKLQNVGYNRKNHYKERSIITSLHIQPEKIKQLIFTSGKIYRDLQK